MRALLAALIVCALATGAQAHHRRHHHHAYRHGHVRHYYAVSTGDPRPAAWCGWYMRRLKGVADRAFNLARNWAHWGHPAPGPAPGVVVVWPHHVGEIVGRAGNGEWLVHSGNDGHAVRTRPRSLAGAIAFRE